MPEERSFPCPNCGRQLQIDARIVEGVFACPGCDQHIAIPPHAAADPEAITAAPAPRRIAPLEEDEAPIPDIRIKPSEHGESLSIPGLLLPLFSAGLIYFGRFESATTELVLSVGTIFLTAILLAVDAWRLGSIDKQGHDRGSGAPLFFGMLILWIVFYPMAYFRRRHFGRPNLGPLAIVVALVFALGPLAAEFLGRKDLPPACDSPEVRARLEGILRKDPHAALIQSIGRFREIKIDEVAKSRRGRCVVDTGNRRVTVGFEVSWVDAKRRAYQVRVLAPDEDSRGFLGIAMRPAARGPGAREGGVLVEDVVPGHAAEKAGLKRGDVIVRIDNRGFAGGNPMASMQDLVIDLDPGAEVKLDVLRGEQRLQIPLTIGRRPADAP